MRDHQALFDDIYRKERWGKGKGSGIGSQPKMAAKYLEYLQRTIVPTSTILDIGCGDHQLYEGFPLDRYDYHGCDVSKEALALAKVRGYTQNLHLVADVGDWLALCADIKPDVVLLKDVLMHWTDEELLQNFVKFSTKFSGRIIVSHNHRYLKNDRGCVVRTLGAGNSWCPIAIKHPVMLQCGFKPTGYWGTKDSRVILER